MTGMRMTERIRSDFREKIQHIERNDRQFLKR